MLTAIDIFQPLFFVGALVLLAQMRPQLTTHDVLSYRQLVSGVTIFAIISVFNLFEQTGMLAKIPFLSDPMFYRVIGWVAVIAGVVLVAGGMATWLPLAKRHRDYSESRLARLDLIRKIERLMAVEHRSDVVLSTSLQYAVEAYDCSAGAIFRAAENNGGMSIVAVHEREGSAQSALDALRFRKEGWPSFVRSGYRDLSQIMSMPDNVMTYPDIVIPMMVNQQLTHLMAYWSGNQTEPDGEDEQNLHLVAEILARKLDSVRMNSESQRLQSQLTIHRNAVQATVKNDLATCLPAWLKGMNGVAETNRVTVLLIDRSQGEAHRFSIGVRGQVLVEKRIKVPFEDQILPSLSDRTPLLDERVRELPQGFKQLIAVSERERSSVVHIMPLDSRFVAVVSLLMSDSSKWRDSIETIQIMIEALLPTLVHFAAHQHRETMMAREKSVQSMLNKCLEATDPEAICKAVADYLCSELNIDAVRISTVSEDDFMQTRALATSTNISAVVPGVGTQILSLMPNHAHVLETGKMLLIDQRKPSSAAPLPELHQMLDEQLTTAVIMPIRWEGATRGVITAMLRDSSDKLSPLTPDVRMRLENAAAVVGLGMADLSPALQKVTVQADSTVVIERVAVADGDLRSRVRSSLSGIMASVEMLKNNPTIEPEQRNRYLAIIDHSADKLSKYLQQEEPNR